MTDDYLDMFRACVTRDALLAATATYWELQAKRFEDALPRPGDWPGRATDEEPSAREAGLRIKIAACRNAARFWRHSTTETPLELTTAETEQQTAA